MVAKGTTAFTTKRMAIHGPLLRAFAHAIELADTIGYCVKVETQFGNVPVYGSHSLADVVDIYDALRDVATC